MQRFSFVSTTSTNTLAMAYAKSHDEDAVFVAEEQTAGRGRLGHTFLSQKGGLYASFLLHPDLPPEQTVRLTVYTAVKAAELLEEMTGVPVGIKWVNDLYMKGKKIAGILTEGAFSEDGTHLRFAVVGIGVNLKKTTFPPDVSAIAVSVEEATGVCPDKEILTEKLGAALAAFSPEEEGLWETYRKRALFLSDEISVIRAQTQTDAVALDINRDFSLHVRYADGTEENLSSGDVHIKRKSK